MLLRAVPLSVVVLVALASRSVTAADPITVMEVRPERATVHTAGVQVLIADDDDRDATIDVRVREVGAAVLGGVITLAAGTYPGSFVLDASGTADAPIVIRGEDRAGVVLDGEGCMCNVLEVYGSFVYVEDLTIAHADRALRFLGSGTTANVVRRVIVDDVVQGIGSGTNQTDFYVATTTSAGGSTGRGCSRGTRASTGTIAASTSTATATWCATATSRASATPS